MYPFTRLFLNVARFLPSLGRGLGANLLFGAALLSGQPAAPSAEEVRELIEQNRRLQEQVRSQQGQIDELRERMAELDKTGDRQAVQLSELREEVLSPAAPVPRSSFNAVAEIRISGEVGLAYFDGGPQGKFPNAEFRADDVKVYLETPVWRDTYFFAELDLVTREANDEYFHMGEVYVDFENISGRLGGPDRLVNLRIGRFDIPFGEEYLRRDVMDNPLISHSLSDIWGIDEGIEIYGGAGTFSYVAAVQNGGHPTLADFDSDKAVVLRVGWQPADWLGLSASAMHTGELHTVDDRLSEVWFGGGFFRALGAAATTATFEASLYELDGTVKHGDTELRGALGTVRFDDDDTTADNARTLDYYYIEATQRITDRLYAAARYSRIETERGYPLVGNGDFGLFMFRSPPTDHLWRFSLGLGYWLADPLLIKVEYTREDGRQVNGTKRDQQDQVAAELGLEF